MESVCRCSKLGSWVLGSFENAQEAIHVYTGFCVSEALACHDHRIRRMDTDYMRFGLLRDG